MALEGQGMGGEHSGSPQLLSRSSNKDGADSPLQVAQVNLVDRPGCIDRGHKVIAK